MKLGLRHAEGRYRFPGAAGRKAGEGGVVRAGDGKKQKVGIQRIERAVVAADAGIGQVSCAQTVGNQLLVQYAINGQLCAAAGNIIAIQIVGIGKQAQILGVGVAALKDTGPRAVLQPVYRRLVAGEAAKVNAAAVGREDRIAGAGQGAALDAPGKPVVFPYLHNAAGGRIGNIGVPRCVHRGGGRIGDGNRSAQGYFVPKLQSAVIGEGDFKAHGVSVRRIGDVGERDAAVGAIGKVQGVLLKAPVQIRASEGGFTRVRIQRGAHIILGCPVDGGGVGTEHIDIVLAGNIGLMFHRFVHPIDQETRPRNDPLKAKGVVGDIGGILLAVFHNEILAAGQGRYDLIGHGAGIQRGAVDRIGSRRGLGDLRQRNPAQGVAHVGKRVLMEKALAGHDVPAAHGNAQAVIEAVQVRQAQRMQKLMGQDAGIVGVVAGDLGHQRAHGDEVVGADAVARKGIRAGIGRLVRTGGLLRRLRHDGQVVQHAAAAVIRPVRRRIRPKAIQLGDDLLHDFVAVGIGGEGLAQRQRRNAAVDILREIIVHHHRAAGDGADIVFERGVCGVAGIAALVKVGPDVRIVFRQRVRAVVRELDEHDIVGKVWRIRGKGSQRQQRKNQRQYGQQADPPEKPPGKPVESCSALHAAFLPDAYHSG